jgi:ADP-ribosylglycohydrolase
VVGKYEHRIAGSRRSDGSLGYYSLRFVYLRQLRQGKRKLAAYLRWRRGSYGSRDQVSIVRTVGQVTNAPTFAVDDVTMDDRNRFRGCLLGGAVGDALGAPIEFMSLSRICKYFGAGGLRDYSDLTGRAGAITDDTQLTLFTAEGLIRGLVQERREGSTDYTRITANAYQRWLLTQGQSNRHGLDPLVPQPGWLYSVKELHSARSPGHTCRAALRDASELGQPARNDSAGCSGVVRIAPVGLFAQSSEESFALGCQLTALTHGHPSARLSGGALAAMITALRQGESLPSALESALRLLRLQPGHEPVARALEHAAELAHARMDSDTAIAHLGEGWAAAEALAIATYAALAARDFREGILMAVNHGGDSDSTGALAGNLLGVIWGEQGIPVPWVKRLELRKVLVEIADDLLQCRDWDLAPGAEYERHLCEKYPGH